MRDPFLPRCFLDSLHLMCACEGILFRRAGLELVHFLHFQYTQAMLHSIQNADGTVSIIQVDPNNQIITLPDGTTAQVQGIATVICYIHSNIDKRAVNVIMLNRITVDTRRWWRHSAYSAKYRRGPR